MVLSNVIVDVPISRRWFAFGQSRAKVSVPLPPIMYDAKISKLYNKSKISKHFVQFCDVTSVAK